MKKILILISAAVFVFALTVPAQSGEAKKVQMTGWIADEYCGIKNANAERADCTKACAKKGADMVLFSDGKLYKISDKEMALEHVGHEVKVTGTLFEGVLTPTAIEKAEQS